MLDLRPAGPRGLERGARLREIFGDLDGAGQLWVAAFRQQPEAESGRRAAVLIGNARLQLSSGRFEAADKSIADALKMFPGLHPALIGLANLRVEQQRYSEAAEILEKDTPGIFFDDKMAVVNASARGAVRGVALPLLLDLARKPAFLHDKSASSLDNLVNPSRGTSAPHAFYLHDAKDRQDMAAFLRSLDTNN